jgi:hypothetical protein
MQEFRLAHLVQGLAFARSTATVTSLLLLALLLMLLLFVSTGGRFVVVVVATINSKHVQRLLRPPSASPPLLLLWRGVGKFIQVIRIFVQWTLAFGTTSLPHVFPVF